MLIFTVLFLLLLKINTLHCNIYYTTLDLECYFLCVTFP